MLQVLAIPAAILLVIFTFIILSPFVLNHANGSTKKLPPGPKPLPIIGNLHILGKLPHRTLAALATKYGPIMSLKLGQLPVVVVSSPEVAELVLKTHDLVFANRPKLQVVETLSYGRKGLVFTEYGGYWRNVRKLCTLQLLSASKVEMFGPLRKKELGMLVNTLKKASDSREVVDLSQLIGEVVENVTFNMILGRSKDNRFDLKGLIHEVMYLIGAFNLADYVPILGSFDLQNSYHFLPLEKNSSSNLDPNQKEKSKQQLICKHKSSRRSYSLILKFNQNRERTGLGLGIMKLEQNHNGRVRARDEEEAEAYLN